MRLGRFQLDVIADTTFRLDGGAMFGVVPKVLWEKVKPADERNRILMTSHTLVLAAEGDVVLVDTGLGDKLDAKARDQFEVAEDGPRLLEALAELGHGPEDVTHVVLTHLHFDHCGWNTRRQGDGWVPTFPRARYWLQAEEVATARSGTGRDRSSYDPRNWEPLFQAGLAELFDDEAEPVPGVRAYRAPGHTAGMCVVLVDGDDDGQACFWADLVPTVAHVPPSWVMSYDLYPVTTMDTKRRWLARAAAEGWLGIFQHDPETPLARLVEDRPGRYRAEAVERGVLV